MQLNEQYTGRV